MHMNRLVATFVVVLPSMVAGCSQRLIDFTIISSKNVDLSRAAGFKRGDARVDGKDTAYIVLFIPTGVPHIKYAVDNAIDKVPGCVALVDGVVRSTYWTALVFGANSVVVEGTPLIDATRAGGRLKSPYTASYVDPGSGETRLAYLEKESYGALRTAIDLGDGAAAEQILLLSR
jgi:hypothetical protein